MTINIPAQLVRQTISGIKYIFIPPNTTKKTTLCFIPGYRSEFMTSRKSHLTYDIAQRNGFGFMAWDHYPIDGSVQQWYENSCQLILDNPLENIYLICSSMGAWISLLLAQRFPNEIRGIVGIGGGVDFTERWLTEQVPMEHRDNRNYIWKRPSQYDPSGYYEIPITSLLDSRSVLLLNKYKDKNNREKNDNNKIQCPIILLHGANDVDVPLAHAQELMRTLQAWGNNNVKLDIIQDGDHRLSRPENLKQIERRITNMLQNN
ncbi:hypothetical protein INT45_000278 [Circinella minor]|uniref:Peptidase S9 prolyl oligopeptidase catalytic domain-containing protein n=1 Tax=Circinella minor TaxID=1195481 RepID=A0A8H7S9M1_9FUNG|nr:hypothetical protein INT45_000278 [Circinella minor]